MVKGTCLIGFDSVHYLCTCWGNRHTVQLVKGAIMIEVNVKELRKHLAQFIHQVETGEEIAITRHGKVVARLLPPNQTPVQLPDLTEFRASIKLKGEGPLETLLSLRDEAR